MPTAIFSRLRYGMTGFSPENDPSCGGKGDASTSLSGLGGEE